MHSVRSLPGLRHLRLRLSTLYPAISEDDFNPNQSSKNVVKVQTGSGTTTENVDRELYPTHHFREARPISAGPFQEERTLALPPPPIF